MVQKSGDYQLRLVVCPAIYKVFYVPAGCLGFLNQQPYVWENKVTKISSKRMGKGELAAFLFLFRGFFVVTFTFGFYKLTWWQQKSPIPTQHLHIHKISGVWYLNILLSYYPDWILWSFRNLQRSDPRVTEPEKSWVSFLLDRNLRYLGPLGFGPIRIFVGYGWYGIFQKRNQKSPGFDNFCEAKFSIFLTLEGW